MAERLHGQVGGEAQAGQVLQFVPGHRAGGILGANSCHQWLAVSARAYALGPAGFTYHLLGQGKTLAGVDGHFGSAEQVRGAQPHGLSCTGSEAATDDQVDTATRAHFIQ